MSTEPPIPKHITGLSDHSFTQAAGREDQYELYLGASNVISAREKGFITWLDKHLFHRERYDISHIAQKIFAFPHEESDQGATVSFIINKIKNYNDAQKNAGDKISGIKISQGKHEFTEIIAIPSEKTLVVSEDFVNAAIVGVKDSLATKKALSAFAPKGIDYIINFADMHSKKNPEDLKQVDDKAWIAFGKALAQIDPPETARELFKEGGALHAHKELFFTIFRGRGIIDGSQDFADILNSAVIIDREKSKQIFVQCVPGLSQEELAKFLSGKFSDTTIALLKEAIEGLEDASKSPIKELVEAFKFMDRILKAPLEKFEKAGDTNTHAEWLHSAFFFETKIKPISEVAGRVIKEAGRGLEYYSKGLSKGVRSMQYDRKNGLIYFGAKKGRSVVRVSGGSKTARSLLKLDLRQITAAPEFPVRLMTRRHTGMAGIRRARNERNINIEYQNEPGIARLEAWCDYTQMSSTGKPPRFEFICVGAQGDALELRGKLKTPVALLQFMGGCLDGLNSLHKKKKSHGDLKLENMLVIIDPITGVITGVLADLETIEGFADSRGFMHRYKRHVTREYTPPELLLADRYPADPSKMEVWDLGISLWMLRSGLELPWGKDMLRFPLLDPSQGLSSAVRSLRDKVLRAMDTRIEKNSYFLEIARKKAAKEELSKKEELDFLIYSMIRMNPENRIDLATAISERDRILALFT